MPTNPIRRSAWRLICRWAHPYGGISLLIWLSVLGAVPRAEPLTSLTEADLREAIAWGESGTAGPYSLRAKHNRAIEAGWVYTPFVRVALAAATSKAAGEPLRPSDIPSSLTKPVIQFAMWRLKLPEIARLEVLETAPSFMEIAESPGAEGRTLPLWVSTDPVSLRDLDVNLGKYDVEIVAAFSMDAVRPGRDILCYRSTKLTAANSGGRDQITGVMRAAIHESDWARWR
jgi:hypothetical protein